MRLSDFCLLSYPYSSLPLQAGRQAEDATWRGAARQAEAEAETGLGVRRWNLRRLHFLSTSTCTTAGGGGGSNQKLTRRLFVPTATQGSSGESDKNIPSWARPDSDEPPPWARNDDDKVSSPLNRNNNLELPFYVYLLASAIIAIAAIGSAFEYVNQRPVFGILNSDSIFYAPLLGFFAFTGIPTSAFLWFKSVQVANKEAEEQDKRDGYR